MSSSTKDEIEPGQDPSSSETRANPSSSPHINLHATTSIDQDIEQNVHKKQDKTPDGDDNHDLQKRSDEEGHRQILEEGGEHSNNDIALQSNGQMGSLSPTSSSSLSSQGSSNAGTNVSLSSEPLAEKVPSSPAAIAVNGEQRSHHIASKTSTSSCEENVPSPGNNLEPSSTKANSPESKGSSGKGRPRSSQGRPRSNSVPFDFHSENESSKYKTLNSSKPGHSLRRGKWTVEEESYVARVIQDFNSGYLNAPPGTTLRTYLSDKLNCDPMRITKKFTGDSCIGKRVFHPAVRCSKNSALIDKAQVCCYDEARVFLYVIFFLINHFLFTNINSLSKRANLILLNAGGENDLRCSKRKLQRNRQQHRLRLQLYLEECFMVNRYMNH